MATRSDDGARNGFTFRAGHAALDLTATMKGRLKDSPVELLAQPADLSRWLLAAGITDTQVSATADDLTTARRLREAVYALAVARHSGEAPPPNARATLNRLAKAEAATMQLDAMGRARLVGDAQALLTTLAAEAIRLLGGEDGVRVRQCEGAVCALLFVDTSRAGDRRWCSMTACGNRAKAAEFRRRKHSGS